MGWNDGLLRSAYSSTPCDLQFGVSSCCVAAPVIVNSTAHSSQVRSEIRWFENNTQQGAWLGSRLATYAPHLRVCWQIPRQMGRRPCGRKPRSSFSGLPGPGISTDDFGRIINLSAARVCGAGYACGIRGMRTCERAHARMCECAGPRGGSNMVILDTTKNT